MSPRRIPYLLFLLPFFLSACGPSYPKERVAQGMVDLCKKEYGIDVRVQLVGTTLGVLVEIPGLLEELMKDAPTPEVPVPLLVDGEYKEKSFHFQFLSHGTFYRVEKEEEKRTTEREETPPRKILKQVSLALSRVSLSTDAPLEFYTLIARDPGPANVDLFFSGHLVDLKRVQYMDISIGEYQRRSRFGLRHQPETVAREMVSDFLRDLSRKPLPQVLSRYVADPQKIRSLFPRILELAVDLQGKEAPLPRDFPELAAGAAKNSKEGTLQAKEWPVRQIKSDQALVVVPLSSLNLPGAVFLVRLGQVQGGLLDIERLEEGALAARYLSLGDPEKWKEFFYLEPLQMSQFLTEQIARRVLSEFQPAPPERKKGLFEPKAATPPQPATREEILRTLVETTAYLVKSYRYTDYDGLTVTDASKGSRWMVKPKDLPMYRRRNAPMPQPAP